MKKTRRSFIILGYLVSWAWIGIGLGWVGHGLWHLYAPLCTIWYGVVVTVLGLLFSAALRQRDERTGSS